MAFRLTTFNKFTFDWNRYSTFPQSKELFAEVESLLEREAKFPGTIDRREFGWLSYQVGTFYLHIRREPDLALPKLEVAEKILSMEGRAWVWNHFAFAYQKKLAVAKIQKNAADTEKFSKLALRYCEMAKNVNFDSTGPDHIKITAFALCIQALTHYELGKMDFALERYRSALDLYEKIDALDDQYARAKNRWAMMLGENKQNKEAQQAFSELENYWTGKKDKTNPYPARFYDSYGDYLSKLGLDNAPAAIDKYKKAYEISRAAEIDKVTEFMTGIHNKIVALEKKLKHEKDAIYSPTLHRKPSPSKIEQPAAENIRPSI